jgi:hypothetical protein
MVLARSLPGKRHDVVFSGFEAIAVKSCRAMAMRKRLDAAQKQVVEGLQPNFEKIGTSRRG